MDCRVKFSDSGRGGTVCVWKTAMNLILKKFGTLTVKQPLEIEKLRRNC